MGTDSLACGQAMPIENSPLDCFQEPSFESVLPKKQRKTRVNQVIYSRFGGGGRIRTIEAKRSRFTVCPLWPLGNSPGYEILFCLNGAGRRTRTPDLLITNQLLYQLSYTGGSNRTRLLYHESRICQAFFTPFCKNFRGGFTTPDLFNFCRFSQENIRIPSPVWRQQRHTGGRVLRCLPAGSASSNGGTWCPWLR